MDMQLTEIVNRQMKIEQKLPNIIQAGFFYYREKLVESSLK